MKNTTERVIEISLFLMLGLGIVLTLIFLFVKNNEKIPESDKEILYLQESKFLEDVTNFVDIEGMNVEVREGNVIATFKRNNYKLEVRYNSNYEVVSKKIIDTRLYKNPLGMVVIFIMGGIFAPFNAWLAFWLIIGGILEIIIIAKKRRNKL